MSKATRQSGKRLRGRDGGGGLRICHPSVRCNHSVISPEHLNNILLPPHQNR